MAILLIDDDDLMRGFMRDILRGGGFEVVTALNGMEGLEAVRRLNGELQCVVTDYVMPGMDGLGLLREIQSCPLTRSLPVIIVSGASIERQARGGGAAAFLSKPFFPEDLLASVQRAVASGVPFPEEMKL